MDFHRNCQAIMPIDCTAYIEKNDSTVYLPVSLQFLNDTQR
jgi:hypothetical protein